MIIYLIYSLEIDHCSRHSSISICCWTLHGVFFWCHIYISPVSLAVDPGQVWWEYSQSSHYIRPASLVSWILASFSWSSSAKSLNNWCCAWFIFSIIFYEMRFSNGNGLLWCLTQILQFEPQWVVNAVGEVGNETEELRQNIVLGWMVSDHDTASDSVLHKSPSVDSIYLNICRRRL